MTNNKLVDQALKYGTTFLLIGGMERVTCSIYAKTVKIFKPKSFLVRTIILGGAGYLVNMAVRSISSSLLDYSKDEEESEAETAE